MDRTRMSAVLTCSACGVEGQHEFVYAGRLLLSSRCCACNHVEQHDAQTVRADYLNDVARRVMTKPARLGRRFVRHPVSSVLALPLAVARKPLRMIAEVRALRRDG